MLHHIEWYLMFSGGLFDGLVQFGYGLLQLLEFRYYLTVVQRKSSEVYYVQCMVPCSHELAHTESLRLYVSQTLNQIIIKKNDFEDSVSLFVAPSELPTH